MDSLLILRIVRNVENPNPSHRCTNFGKNVFTEMCKGCSLWLNCNDADNETLLNQLERKNIVSKRKPSMVRKN